ncbi:MAG TPA: hypothetical protein VFN29_00680 [Chiayiivirga sp.]|nr:hypothetical protein [Chiayiivirga sp.]
MWTWILAVALIGLAAAWIPWVRQAPVAPSSSIEAERLAAPVSVAVLPLANTSGDASQQFFSDGLSGSLIDALSKFDGIRVIGRMSSFRFRDSQDDSKAIGAQLGVAYLISGTVQHAGDAVRIGIELSSTADGRTVWAEHFDRPYTNLFALQDEITRAVAAELPVHLTASGRSPPLDDRPASGSIEAYSAYLQGWKYWHDENFRTAARYLGEAVKLDPDYAMAWAQLSGSWSTVARFSNEAPEQAAEHMRLAREAADHALRLAPALGAAHAAHAYLAFYDFDFHQATTACLRAVQLSPNDSMVLNGCSFTLTGSGQLGQSLQLRDRLRSIEPMYAVNNFAYSALLAMVGRLDEAEKALRLAEELAQAAPLDHLQLALLRGDAAAATAIAERLPTASRMLFTTLAAQIGPDQAMADQALDSLLADQAGLERLGSGGSNEDGFYVVAQIQALRGDLDQTLKWLKRSLASAPSRALFLLDDAFILRFRDDARFIAFCQELGLPPPSDSEALSLDQIRARAKHATVNAAHEPRAGHNHESVKTTPQ